MSLLQSGHSIEPQPEAHTCQKTLKWRASLVPASGSQSFLTLSGCSETQLAYKARDMLRCASHFTVQAGGVLLPNCEGIDLRRLPAAVLDHRAKFSPLTQVTPRHLGLQVSNDWPPPDLPAAPSLHDRPPPPDAACVRPLFLGHSMPVNASPQSITTCFEHHPVIQPHTHTWMTWSCAFSSSVTLP